MREEDYRDLFEMIEMKSDMKRRIINECHNIHSKRSSNKGVRALIVAACCALMFLGANVITTYAYGYNIVSKFYEYVHSEDTQVVDIKANERRDASRDKVVNTSMDDINQNLYDFLETYEFTDLVLPKNIAEDWKLTSGEAANAKTSEDKHSSVYFTLSNGTEYINGSIDDGYADKSTYRIGLDYAETKEVNDIEFLVVHKDADLTYEEYLNEVEDYMVPFMETTVEEYYKTKTAEFFSDKATYDNYMKYKTFIDFSVGGYDYSYGLSDGMNVDEFINSLVQE